MTQFASVGLIPIGMTGFLGATSILEVVHRCLFTIRDTSACKALGVLPISYRWIPLICCFGVDVGP